MVIDHLPFTRALSFACYWPAVFLPHVEGGRVQSRSPMDGRLIVDNGAAETYYIAYGVSDDSCTIHTVTRRQVRDAY